MHSWILSCENCACGERNWDASCVVFLGFFADSDSLGPNHRRWSSRLRWERGLLGRLCGQFQQKIAREIVVGQS